MNRPQAWSNCDEDIKSFITTLTEKIKNEIGNNLVGIYLHGSLAMGSYYRPKSDIDIIVVVDHRLENETARCVGIAIALQSKKRPTIGDIELSIITKEVAKQVPVPTPYELHFGTEWTEKILNNEVDYSKELTDSDLPSHLTYVLQRGICLYGQPIQDVFGEYPWQSFIDSVMYDLEWILDEENILESPYYSILNISRVFQLVTENIQKVHSKDEGGEWGLLHLPKKFHPLIQQALDVYRSPKIVSEEERKTGGREWNSSKLLAFRDYAREKLLTL
ncbi:aminoglycoside adenylyltransferase domain-containing protein [Lederbergia wuyishanensis]|uniref:Streptomycin 3'-adenylyltransferase n=1 Tax=Lederbergia wuyishanensis TaxID=1347903 RepID=A0ABU0D6K5_9BACI|nr:aminoglycoside adenylyltransferase domain-containing protein [Lederbergia wuyishanensis]MCJ8008547.1 DUF4111 domain-containing protein [Lederbergia wuyishanensis]MDQ0344039.1 streptomycin 3'-adenylyltransferase [Lederbergia wuyishanensis]